MILAIPFFSQYLALYSATGEHTHSGELLVAQRPRQHICRVDIKHKMRGTELQQVVIGTLRYFVEGIYFATLHSLASL